MALTRLGSAWQSQTQVEEFIADVSTVDLTTRFLQENLRPDSRLIGIWLGLGWMGSE